MRRWMVVICLLLWCGSCKALRADTYTPDNVRRVELTTRELVYDPVSRMIYASVPGEAGFGGNSVVPINPMNGEIGLPIPVGSQPSHLAVSDDGKYLYVSLDTGDVRRVDLTTGKPAGLFRVGGVRQIAVIPGQHDLIAVSRGGGAGMGAGVALFENGVMRPDTGGPNGFALSFGSLLYTYQNEISSWDFNRYAIKSTGLMPRGSTGSLLSGNLGISGDGNGRIYTNIGVVIDPESQSVLARLPGGGYESTPIPDPKVNRVFFLDGGHIFTDDYTTFVSLDKMDLEGIRDGGGLIRWGTDGLAFRTEKYVYLLRTPMVGKQVKPVDLSVTATHSPSKAAVGRQITSTIVVVNNGRVAATGVTLTFHFPPALAGISAKSTMGQVTTEKGRVVVDIGDLPVGGRCTLTVVLSPQGEGDFATTAVVRGNAWDDRPSNNVSEDVIK